MISLVFGCVLAFAVGGIWGKSLARQGITSDNALKNYQKQLVWLLLAIALGLGLLIVLDKFNLTPILPKIFPAMLLIYLAGYFHQAIVWAGCFSLGLLIFLELLGSKTRKQVKELVVALGAIAFALSILVFFLQPVEVAKPKISNGVVMQTTLYTCSPASIATIARYSSPSRQPTEAEVVELAKTNRFGTTTLKELKAMHKLGLNPQYRHNQTLDDLQLLNQPALMHVKEKRRKGKGVRFSHAVAYLGIDPAKELVFVGNPLFGLQAKTFAEMEKYWFGEIIVTD